MLPGDATPIVYGSGIQQGSTVTFTGPVYSLTDFNNALCAIGTTCAATSLLATVGADGTYAAFVVPAGAAPGAYYIKVRSSVGVDSSNNQWIAVDSPQQTRPLVTPELHHQASRIYPGQTVTGELSGDNLSGSVADYNYYYFVATAGSRVSISMERVDTSVPWENPASLDPQVEVVAPDGFVYENLLATDNQPSIDLNASITDAVLPRTGVYIIAAETTRGSGQYRLTFNVSSMAPAPVGNRAIPVTGNFATLPLNAPVKTSTLMLDARGWPVSGASVTFTNQNGSGDTGGATFSPGTTTTTQIDGTAISTVRMTTTGRARFKPTFNSPQFAALLYRPSEAALAQLGSTYDANTDEVLIPRYRAVAKKQIRIYGNGTNRLDLKAGATTPIAVEQRAVRQVAHGKDEPSRAPLASPQTPGAASARGSRAEPKPLTVIRQPLVITSCAAELEVFSETGVSASQLNVPFTVTLTDLSPSTGQSVPNGPVDTVTGIHGHRINNADGTPKTIRLKIDIKDSTGNTPTHPVLVSLSLGGYYLTRPGTLILDPDGARIECYHASFIWHEQDAQGHLIAPNEEIEYRYGNYSAYVGAISDPGNPGQTLPVWGTTEAIDLTLYAVDPNGDPSPTTVFDASYAIHPEPFKPDHLACVDENGQVAPDVFPFWAGYLAFQQGQRIGGTPRLVTNPATIYNAYVLVDADGNGTFGYRLTSATQPSNVTVGFADQTTTGPGFNMYTLSTSWTNDPNWPSGSVQTTLGVHYLADPDWSAGDITPKVVTYLFDSGPTHALAAYPNYDLVKPDGTKGFTDGPMGTFPISVSPAATTGALPKTEAGDTERLVLLAYAGSTIPGSLPQPEPYRYGTRQWYPQGSIWNIIDREGEPQLAIDDRPSFKLTLIDDFGKPVTDGASFRAWTCARFDHDVPTNAPCSTYVDSDAQGVVSTVTLTSGYLGLELLKAPRNPGPYYVLVESLGQNYRIRRQSDYTREDHDAAGEFKGAFALCVVTGGQFLDAHFVPIDPYVVDEPITAYYRYLSSTASSPSLTATIDSKPEGGTTTTDSITIALNRLGQSALYLTPAFTLVPPAPDPAPLSRAALTSGGTLLIAAPLSDLLPTISGLALPKGRAIAGDIKIKTESRYVGNGRTGALWKTLDPTDVTYLGDDLRLTAQPPAAWTATPSAYLWHLAIDGVAYLPPCDPPAPCVDLDQSTLVLAPLQKAGKLDITVEVTYSSGVRTGRSERPIWLETAATSIVSWIDGDAINLDALFPGEPLTSCAGIAAAVPKWLLGIPEGLTSPQARAAANAGLLKWGAISAPPLSFDSEDVLAQFIDYRRAEYKLAQGVQYRAEVRNGGVLTTFAGDAPANGRALLKKAKVGFTELKFPCTGFTLGTMEGEAFSTNEKVFRLQTGTSIDGFFTLNKGRIGWLARRLYDLVNLCTNCTPFIWNKSIFTTDTPFPRTDWLSWRTSFPTQWLYFSEGAADDARNYPIKRTVINPQVANPNDFLQNPDRD